MCAATTFCHVVLVLKKDYLTYRAIAEWLGDFENCRTCGERVVCKELSYALLDYFDGDIKKAYTLVFTTQNFSVETQKKIAKWISDSSSSRTPAC